MKHIITPTRRRRCQRGFSILEILIATVLISLLVASGLYYANVGDKAATVSIAAAKVALATRFPEALMTIYAQKQTLLSTTAADLVGTGSVRAGSPVAWTVAADSDAPTATGLSVNLTFSDESVAKTLESYLKDNMDSMLVSSAEIDNDSKEILKVTYSVE